MQHLNQYRNIISLRKILMFMLISWDCPTDVHLRYSLNGNYNKSYQQILSLLLTSKVFVKNMDTLFLQGWNLILELQSGAGKSYLFFHQLLTILNLLFLPSFLILFKFDDHLRCRTAIWKRKRYFLVLLQHIRFYLWVISFILTHWSA